MKLPKKDIAILAGLAGFWLLIFVLVFVEHARSWARLLPVIGLAFIGYAAWVTWKLTANKPN